MKHTHNHQVRPKVSGWDRIKAAGLTGLLKMTAGSVSSAEASAAHQPSDKVTPSLKRTAWEWTKAIGLTGAMMLPATSAFALPWETPLCTVAQSLSGPVANSIGVIVVVLTGLMLAFGEVSGIFKTLLGVLFGLSVAFLANSWLGLFDGRSSGCFASS